MRFTEPIGAFVMAVGCFDPDYNEYAHREALPLPVVVDMEGFDFNTDTSMARYDISPSRAAPGALGRVHKVVREVYDALYAYGMIPALKGGKVQPVYEFHQISVASKGLEDLVSGHSMIKTLDVFFIEKGSGVCYGNPGLLAHFQSLPVTDPFSVELLGHLRIASSADAGQHDRKRARDDSACDSFDYLTMATVPSDMKGEVVMRGRARVFVPTAVAKALRVPKQMHKCSRPGCGKIGFGRVRCSTCDCPKFMSPVSDL